MSNLCQKRSSISPTLFTPLFLALIFSFPYPAFHFHLLFNLYCQPFRTGIGVRTRSASITVWLTHYEINLSFMYLFLHCFTCLLHFCSCASISSYKSSPPHLAASVCSSEVSLDVCQTAQDFVTHPNSISTFCGHFISRAYSQGGPIRPQSSNVGRVRCANHSLRFTPGKNNHMRRALSVRPSHPHAVLDLTQCRNRKRRAASFPQHEQLA